MSVCRCLKRTEQDGDGCHHAAAEGENNAAGCVRAVWGFNGDIEIECIEDPDCTQQRGQGREKSGNSAALTAFTLAAAAAASSPIRSPRRGFTSLCLLLWTPHSQLHALWRRAYQRSPLVHGAVQIGGFWTPSRCVCAVGNVSLRGLGWTADAVFHGGIQIVRCDDRKGKSLIQLPLVCLICSWLVREVVSGLLVAGSRACSEQSTFYYWIQNQILKTINCRCKLITSHSLTACQDSALHGPHVTCWNGGHMAGLTLLSGPCWPHLPTFQVPTESIHQPVLICNTTWPEVSFVSMNVW